MVRLYYFDVFKKERLQGFDIFRIGLSYLADED